MVESLLLNKKQQHLNTLRNESQKTGKAEKLYSYF